MPFLTIHTNAKLKEITTQGFVEQAAQVVADELHKPISYIVVNFDENPSMSFGGKMNNFGALVEMKSIGFASRAQVAQVLTEFLLENLEDVKANNINIEFRDMNGSDVAIGGQLLG